MKSSLDTRLANLEVLATSVSDSDTEWWPFAFLRPAQHERLSSARCLLFCTLQSAPAALLALILGVLLGDRVQSLHLLLFPPSVCLAYFLAFRFTFAYFWNRRANRLRPLWLRRSHWRASSGGPSSSG